MIITTSREINSFAKHTHSIFNNQSIKINFFFFFSTIKQFLQFNFNCIQANSSALTLIAFLFSRARLPSYLSLSHLQSWSDFFLFLLRFLSMPAEYIPHKHLLYDQEMLMKKWEYYMNMPKKRKRKEFNSRRNWC